MKLSKNGSGLIILVLSLIAPTVTEGDIITTISTIGQILSGVLLFWNQVARPDVRGFLLKK